MQKLSVKSQVYESILNDIMDGVYPTNAVLNEKTLVEQYGVSKTPVREALVQLCSEGVLTSYPRFGYQLVSIAAEEIVEIVEFRKVVELAALELTFYDFGEKELAELKHMNVESRRITELKDTHRHWRRNLEFHRRLCAGCGNRYLRQSLDSALNICTRISNQYFTKLWKESRSADAENHILLVRAIEEKRLNAAKEILAADVEAFKKEIL